MTAELPENVRLTLQAIADKANRGAAYDSSMPHEDLGFKTSALTSVADLAESLLAHPDQPLDVHAAASSVLAAQRRYARKERAEATLRRSLREAMQP